MPIGLALSGGGAKGAFQVGVLKYLYEERDIQPDIVCGTSVGALNAAKLAEGGDAFSELEAVWRGIGGNWDIYELNPALATALQRARDRAPGLLLEGIVFDVVLAGTGLGDIYRRGVGHIGWGDTFSESLSELFGPIESYYVTDQLRDLVTANLATDVVADSNIRLRMSAVDLSTGMLYYVDGNGAAYPSSDAERTVAGYESLVNQWEDNLQSLSSAAQAALEVWPSSQRLGLAFESEILGDPGLPGEIIQRMRSEPPESVELGLVDGVMASAAMPVAFPPVHQGPHMFVDGGVREVMPLQESVRLGGTEVYAILASSRRIPSLPIQDPESPFRALSIINRTLDALLHEITLNDLRLNLDVEPVVIAPEWSIQDTLDFGAHITALNIWYGYETARYEFEGGSSPTNFCLYYLKSLAHKLDSIDSLLRVLEHLYEQYETEVRAGLFDGFLENLSNTVSDLRGEASDIQEILDQQLGCDRIAGVNRPENIPDLSDFEGFPNL